MSPAATVPAVGNTVCLNQRLVREAPFPSSSSHPRQKIQLMSRSVIDPCPVPPRLTEIPLCLLLGAFGQLQLLVPRRRPLPHGIVEALEALVAEAGAAGVFGRELVYRLADAVEDVEQMLHGRRDLHGRRVGHVQDRVGKVGDEVQQQSVRGRCLEQREIVLRDQLAHGRREREGILLWRRCGEKGEVGRRRSRLVA
jgi:hypothetical protein